MLIVLHKSQCTLSSNGLYTAGVHHHHHRRRRRRREKLLATYLSFVRSNRGTKMKPVRQALVLTYRTKPVPEMKYANCRTDISPLYTPRISYNGHLQTANARPQIRLLDSFMNEHGLPLRG
jgi:hypothetical protein